MKQHLKIEIRMWIFVLLYLITFVIGTYELYKFDGLNFYIKMVIFLPWMETSSRSIIKELDSGRGKLVLLLNKLRSHTN